MKKKRFFMLFLLTFLFVGVPAEALAQGEPVIADALTDGGPDWDARDFAKVYAHRGFHHTAPENSLGALAAAASAGFAGTETDAHKTKDGEFVCFHDCDLKRMLGTEGRIEDMTLNEIRQLSLPDGERVPTVEEWVILSMDLGMDLYLELKDYMTEEDCRYLYGLCGSYTGHVVFGAFDIETCKNLRAAAPDAVINHLCGKVDGNLLKTYEDYGFGCHTNYANFTEDQYALFVESGVPLNFWTFRDAGNARTFLEKYHGTFFPSDAALW